MNIEVTAFTESKKFYYSRHFLIFSGDLQQYNSRNSRRKEPEIVKGNNSNFYMYPKKLECDQCGKLFAFQSKLDTHYRMHTGVKPFVCTDCGLAFSQQSNLNAHCRTQNHMGLTFW